VSPHEKAREAARWHAKRRWKLAADSFRRPGFSDAYLEASEMARLFARIANQVQP
jgi:hypothetical protein